MKKFKKYSILLNKYQAKKFEEKNYVREQNRIFNQQRLKQHKTVYHTKIKSTVKHSAKKTIRSSIASYRKQLDKSITKFLSKYTLDNTNFRNIHFQIYNKLSKNNVLKHIEKLESNKIGTTLNQQLKFLLGKTAKDIKLNPKTSTIRDGLMRMAQKYDEKYYDEDYNKLIHKYNRERKKVQKSGKLSPEFLEVERKLKEKHEIYKADRERAKEISEFNLVKDFYKNKK